MILTPATAELISSVPSPLPLLTPPGYFAAAGVTGEGNPTAAVSISPKVDAPSSSAPVPLAPTTMTMRELGLAGDEEDGGEVEEGVGTGLTRAEVREVYEKVGVRKQIAEILAAKVAGKAVSVLAGKEEEILARLYEGEAVERIARSVGLPTAVLLTWVRAGFGPQWKEIQAARALAGLEQAVEDTEDALGPFKLSKAAQAIKAHQWRLERASPEEYGANKGAIVGVNINVVIDPSCGGVVKLHQPIDVVQEV